MLLNAAVVCDSGSKQSQCNLIMIMRLLLVEYTVRVSQHHYNASARRLSWKSQAKVTVVVVGKEKQPIARLYAE